MAIAAIVNRRSQRPALIFTEITVALTAVSFIPSLVVDAEPATKAVLVITHVVAAAIVIPTIAKQLAQ